MKIAREVEKRLERLVDGLSAVIFRGRMHSVDLAGRIIREADLRIQEAGTGATIPNAYRLRVPAAAADASGITSLEEELAGAVESEAAERGWRLEGPVHIEVLTGGPAQLSPVVEHAAVEPGPLPAWGHLIDSRDGTEYPLEHNRALIGRVTDADLRLDHPEISRRHAILFREGGHVWVRDLASANGTSHNGRRVGTDPISVVEGDQVKFGPVSLTYRSR